MVTITREVDSSPEAVIAVLADGWSYATWVVGTSRIRGVDPTWPAPGSRIAHSVGLWPVLINDTTTVRAWDPAGRIELQARGWPVGEARVRIEVSGGPGGRCTVVMSEDAIHGPGALLPKPVRSVLLVPRNAESLRRLAMLAERRAVGRG